MRRTSRGVTLIELMVVVALAAIVLTLAAPSFSGFLAKKRVEGVLSELVTDLQYARSEAVSKNTPVRVTFGTLCYVITAQPADGTAPTSSCSQTADPTLGTGAGNIKQVQLKAGSTASFDNSGLTWLEVDPVRGIATFSTGATSGAIPVNSSVGTWQLQAQVCTMGRVSVCSPNSSVTGYSSSCAC
jgi:type IV fimbrial biogenesis protein FimT